MIIYYLSFFAMSLISLIEYSKKWKPVVSRNRTICWVCFAVIFLLFALRHESMGDDLHYLESYGYLGAFDRLAAYPLLKAFTIKNYLNYERGYIIYNAIIGHIWNNRQFFLAVSAAMAFFPIAKLYSKYSDSPFLSVIIFVGLPSFLINYSGLRQSIAIGISAIATQHIIDKKKWKFIITVILASLFHTTAILFLAAYPLFHMRINRTARIVTLFLVVLTFAFRTTLLTVLSSLFRYYYEPVNTGAFTFLLIFLFIYIIAIVFQGEDEIENGFINFLFIVCFCQVLATVSNLAMRAGYYFMIYIPLLIPMYLNNTRLFSKANSRLVAKGMVLFTFAFFGFYLIANSKWAMANPYIFFWQNPNNVR